MNIVITGTSRGIGLELARQAAARGDKVLALARDVKAAALEKLKREYPDLITTAALDVANPEAAARVTDALKSWSHVDVLINNAGVLNQGVGREEFLASFTVNSIAPFEITSACLPWLKKSANPRVVQITSLMGSIADNGSGGYYTYRASKAALNMINKSLALDNPWLTTFVIHPGWVQTDMGGKGAPTSVEDSARGIWAVAQNIKAESSGEFFDFRGKSLPW